MGFTSLIGVETNISAVFINPYDGTSLSVDGVYYLNVDPVVGSDPFFNLLGGNPFDQFWRIEDDEGNLLIDNFQLYIPSTGNDILLLASTTHVLGDLQILLSPGNDIVWSNAGDDLIEGNEGDDILHGGPGNDFINGGIGADVIIGGSGNDTADYSDSSAGVHIDLLNGTSSGGHADGDQLSEIENVTGSDLSSERDWLYGDDSANILMGLSGADILEGGGGADVIDGGDGWDYARYERSDEGVNINLLTNVNTGGDAEGDMIFNVEAVVGSAHDDVIIGASDKDYIRGGHGDDYLDGGAGGDQLFGEYGNDTYFYGSGRDTFHEINNGGVDRVVFDAAYSLEDLTIVDNVFVFEAGVNEVIFNNISLFETFSFSGEADMTLADLLFLQNGADVVGNGANNVFTGTSDAESYDGQGGFDTINYNQSLTAVRVDLAAGVGSQGDADGDSYISIENVIGNDVAGQRDFIWGNDADNLIQGLNGDDILEGGGGADTILGGAGWDYVRYTRSEEGVNINLETGVHTGGDAQGDTFSNIEAVVGSSYNDTIRGGSGNDFLRGGDGDDIIGGGAGRDLLHGDGGADMFVFTDFNLYNHDVVRDFDASEGDTLNISDLLSGYDPLDDAIADFVRLVDAGGNTEVQINSNGCICGSFKTAFAIEGGISDTVSDLVDSGTLITNNPIVF